MRGLRFVLFSIVFITVSFSSNAQDYRTALGLRLGSSTGITAKHFLSRGAAIEGLLTSRWHGFMITGLYEFTGNAFNEPNLGWYIGGGAHIGNSQYNWRHRRESRAIFGVDFIIGLEYTVQSLPLNLALDWKPAVNLIGNQDYWGDEFAFSIRIAFK